MGLQLYPFPRKMLEESFSFDFRERRWIYVDSCFVSRLHVSIIQFSLAVEGFFAQRIQVAAGMRKGACCLLSVKHCSEFSFEEYRLRTVAEGFELEASSESGVFYGLFTLRQILEQTHGIVPSVVIEDKPDFAVRGFMLDISRCKVPRMETLKMLVDYMASLKLNQFQLYTEHTFAFAAHETVWNDASPMTHSEILELDAYCRERFIELAPNFNSFGHFGRWLKHVEYRNLAEMPDGFVAPSGECFNHGTVLKPHRDSLRFLDSLYDELLPNFQSSLFNVGCDETWELGQGYSKKRCERLGKTRVYLDFLLKVDRLVRKYNHRMMFWGDIILEEPERVKELPKDIVALNWGYEAHSPFARQGAVLAESKIPYYVCPGTSSWRSITGRVRNALGNLKSAAKNGLCYGAEGYLITDWGDCGHHQSCPISYPGLLAGACYAWSYKANSDADIVDGLNRIFFKDETGETGRLLYALGELPDLFSEKFTNCAPFAHFLFSNVYGKSMAERTPEKELKDSVTRLEELQERLIKLRPQSSDATLIKAELDLSLKMTDLSLKRAMLLKQNEHPSGNFENEARRIIGQYEKLWLKRNRLGGLHESSMYLRREFNLFTG